MVWSEGQKQMFFTGFSVSYAVFRGDVYWSWLSSAVEAGMVEKA